MKKNGQKLTLQKKNNLLSLTNKKLPSKKWSFSFLYFKEIDYFGLSEEDNKWFIGEPLSVLYNYLSLSV